MACQFAFLKLYIIRLMGFFLKAFKEILNRIGKWSEPQICLSLRTVRLLIRCGQSVTKMSKIFPFLCVGCSINCSKAILLNISINNCSVESVDIKFCQSALGRFKSPIRKIALTFLRRLMVVRYFCTKSWLLEPNVPNL